jgi:large subunit ribosomal protein L25
VNAKEFENILKSRKSNHMPFRLTVENGEQIGCTVLLKEIQIHPISRKYLHADFYEVPANRKVKVKVPVVAKGLAKGVELGGMIQIIRRELVVICYPQDIPEAIEIDVTNLGIGEAVHIKELSFEGLEFPADANVTVITLLGKEKGKEGSERAEGSEEAESAPSKK